MKFKGVLFDKDGTLVDFHNTWMSAYRQAVAMVACAAQRPGIEARLLEVAGYDAGTDRCTPTSPLACGTTPEIAVLWAREAGVDETWLTPKVEDIFRASTLTSAQPVKDLQAVLARLQSRGFRLGVATMDSSASANATLARLGIDDYFDFVCGYDSGYGKKPESGMVDAFCRQLKLRHAEIVLVGDTPHDLEMGRSAKVGLVVGVLTGSSTGEQLAPLCDAVIPGISDLEALLDHWEAA